MRALCLKKFIVITLPILAALIFCLEVNARTNSTLENQGDLIFSNLKESKEKSRVKNSDYNFALIDNYRKFYLEDEKLEYFCRENSSKLRFKNIFERDEFYRSIVATLQYKMINYSMQAIAHYAKKLQFESDQYDNLINGLIGSCSKNLTLFSHRLLKHLFTKYYSDSSIDKLRLPYSQRENLFASNVNEIQSENEVVVNELYYTTGVFSYACSWGGQEKYLRNLAPFLSSSLVMSYIVREISALDSHVYKDQLNDGKVANCRNQICRPYKKAKVQKEIVRPIGSSNLNFDLKVAYCDNFKFASKKFSPSANDSLKNQLKKFEKDENIVIAQFVSLLTRVPEFNVWTQDSKTIKRYVSVSNDSLWDYWAKDLLEKNSNKLPYEEALSMKLDVKTSNDSILRHGYPEVNFVVLNGEFDKATNIDNMVSLKFEIEIPHNDFMWLYRNIRSAKTFDDKEKSKELKERLSLYVANDYNKIKETLNQFSVDADLTTVITDELIRQFNYIEFLRPKSSHGTREKIDVRVNIAPFALVAIRNKRIISELSERDLKNIKSLEVLNNIESMAEKAK
ncbi:hypothetical protein [Halobacteriovorax sp. YZS-1-1]|uniref:hypothetical protein n=1 Tax=unclassified Halobacteriovorax TaxID=2639665 RepID=UPI0039999C62